MNNTEHRRGRALLSNQKSQPESRLPGLGQMLAAASLVMYAPCFVNAPFCVKGVPHRNLTASGWKEPFRMTGIDWLILGLYFAFVLGIGVALKGSMKTSTDFFLAGRAIPAWVAGLAFMSANLGAQEVIGIFMMPFYYGSRARSVPEYLRLRFDEKTRGLNAISFAVMTIFSSGISMY